MKIEMKVRLLGVVGAALLCGILAGNPAAAEEATEQSPRYNVNFSLADNLRGFTGKTVYVHLKSGQTLTGTVKEVGNHLVHLEKLVGKEFYDALVRLDEISAVDARFR